MEDDIEDVNLGVGGKEILGGEGVGTAIMDDASTGGGGLPMLVNAGLEDAMNDLWGDIGPDLDVVVHDRTLGKRGNGIKVGGDLNGFPSFPALVWTEGQGQVLAERFSYGH